MIVRLDDEIWFPDPRKGDDDGIFAVGGDLSPQRLVLAYNNGIFPWYAFRKEDNAFCDDDGNPWIQWWCPMQRFVIFPDEIHVSHSMHTLLNKQRYVCSFNLAFDRVMHYCGNLRIAEAGAWLGPHIVEAYTELYKLGFCMSVEVWDTMPSLDETDLKGQTPYYNKDGYLLVGGLYGVTMGSCFIGESMFSLVPNGSKIALIFLAEWMSQHDGGFIDCQLETSHLRSMGGRFIDYDEYLKILKNQE